MRTLVDPATLVAAALAATLFAVTMAFGGVHLWAGAVLQIVVWCLAGLWLAAQRPARAVPRSFVLAAIALVGFLSVQLLPLSSSTLATLSPTTAKVYARTRDVVESLSISPAPIRPLGSRADEVVSVADREAIRALAAQTRSSVSGGSQTIALDPFRARFELLRYVAYGLVLWMAATLPRPRFLHAAIVAVGVIVSLVGLAEASTRNGLVLWFFEPYDKPLPPSYARVLGSFVNADHFSGFVALTFGPAFALLSSRRDTQERRSRKRSRIPLDPIRVAAVTVCLAILTAALLGSGSRGGIFGAALSAIVVWAGRARDTAPAGGWKIIRGRERRNRTARLRRILDRVAPAMLAALVLIAGVTYVGSSGRQMLDQRLAQTVYQDDLEIRMAFWRQTLPMIRDFPWVGTGLGGWSEAVQRYQAYPNVWSRQNHSHNDYLEWLVEVGAVGAFLTAILGISWAAWARRNLAIPTIVRAGFLGSIAAIAWHEVFDFVLRVPANAVALSMILGLLCNPHWEPSEPSPVMDEGILRGRRMRWIRASVAAALVFLASVHSYGYVGEFLEWKRVRDGDARIRRSVANPATWEMLDQLLSRAGFRRYPPTLDCIVTALRLRSTSEQAVYRLSKILPGGPERLRVLETALFLDPTRSEWRLEYAAELERGGRLAEALFQIEEAVRLDPVLARHSYATSQSRQVAREVISAVESGLRRAVAEHGEIAAILSDLAVLLNREARFGEAASLWLRAAHVSSDWERFGVRAGEAYAREANYQSAERVLRQVIAEVPEAGSGYRVLALDVLQPQGRLDEAERALQVGTRRSRDRVRLFLALSSLYRTTGRRAESLEAYSDAADAAPRNAELQYQLGIAYLDAGDPHRARSAFGRAIRLDAQKAHFHFGLGGTQERLRELGEARRAYSRALEIEPGNPRYREALDRITSTFIRGNEG